MRTIAVMNLKGGVAKTVTVINTAAILAADHKQTVLVIDADSQCDTTEFLQRDKLHPFSLSDLLRKGFRADDCHIEHSSVKGVDLLRADKALMELDLTKVELGSASAVCIREMLAVIGRHYDWCLIDCPTAFNAATAAALVAADEVLIPIKVDAFSLRGMSNIFHQIRTMSAVNPKLKVAGLLPTMWYKKNKIIEAESQLRASGLPVFSHIRRTPKVDDMTFEELPIITMSPRSAAAKDYRRFVAELIKGVKANG